MSKYINNRVFGIDVDADFSIAAILSPNGFLELFLNKSILNSCRIDSLFLIAKSIETK